MQEIILPSLVGALLAISWYWLMDFLPPFRTARRGAEVPAAQPEAARAEDAGEFADMLNTIVMTMVVARQQEALRIAVIQTGDARANIPALQQAVGASHAVTVVSVDQALQNKYDVLVSVGDQSGAVPGSILKVYNMNVQLEGPRATVSAAVGTPKR